jgi:hypothetical protein
MPSERGGSWRVGVTALSIYVLATCGVPPNDPAIGRGLAFLRSAATRGYDYRSYESSAVVLMLAALHDVRPSTRIARSDSVPGRGFDDKDWRWLRRCVQSLRECDRGDLYGYTADPGEDEALPGDVSSTHFAALALRAASFAGHPVDSAMWAGIVEAHVAAQGASGGFPYRKGQKPSPGMTAAALSTLLICREQLALRREREPPLLAPTIEKGFGYLDRHFDVLRNPSPHAEGESSFHYCHLFAIGSAATLAARPRIGGRDWYGSGAAFLVAQQGGNGSWVDPTSSPPEDVLGTCFALLFLKKATIPAVTR